MISKTVKCALAFVVFSAQLSCDATAPDDVASKSYTSQAGLRIRVTVDPASFSGGREFQASISVRNVSNAAITISGPRQGSSGTQTVSFGRHVFTKGGDAANQLLTATAPPCMVFWGELVNDRAVAILPPDQELFTLGACAMDYLSLVPFVNTNTPPGTYSLTYEHGLRVEAPVIEEIPPVTVQFKIK